MSTETNDIEKLRDNANFHLWKFQISIIFKSYELFGIVSGKEKLENLNDEKKKEDWVRKDARAQKYIITTIETGPMLHLLNCKNSCEMFEKLSMIYERDSDQQKYALL